MDLSKPLPIAVILDCEEDVTQNISLKVVYEGLHTICFHCGEFGHKLESCNYRAIANAEGTNSLHPTNSEKLTVETTTYGPWNLARPRRRGDKKRSPAAPKPNTKFPSHESSLAPSHEHHRANSTQHNHGSPLNQPIPNNLTLPTQPTSASNRFLLLADSGDDLAIQVLPAVEDMDTSASVQGQAASLVDSSVPCTVSATEGQSLVFSHSVIGNKSKMNSSKSTLGPSTKTIHKPTPHSIIPKTISSKNGMGHMTNVTISALSTRKSHSKAEAYASDLPCPLVLQVRNDASLPVPPLRATQLANAACSLQPAPVEGTPSPTHYSK